MGVTLLVVSGAARAVVVTPVVSSSSAAVGTFAAVPFPGFPLPFTSFAVDVQPTNASVAASIDNLVFDGAETAEGEAEVAIDTTDINNSVVKAKSKVFTADAPPPSQEILTTDRSVGGLSATLSTDGLAPADTASVNLLLGVTGSLIYNDPTGSAGTFEVEDPFDPTMVDIVPDMTASVSVILALADVLPVTGPEIPEPLPFETLFDGSVVLESTTGAGTTPDLIREGDWADVARDLDFTTIGTCDAFFCQINISTSILFEDVQSLGFGETFEAGLILLTNVEGISDSGRSLESNFFDTASFELSFTLLTDTPVPEPATWLLMAFGLAAFGVRRNRAI
jgi:hypothetical protein